MNRRRTLGIAAVIILFMQGINSHAAEIKLLSANALDPR
jgi:hypothetical protein